MPVSQVLALDPAWSRSELERCLKRFSTWPESSRLVIGFPNAGSASRILQLLSGESEMSAPWTDLQFRELVQANGLTVVTRKGFTSSDSVTQLAGHTERALRQLLVQLNEATADEWLLYQLAPPRERPQAPEGWVPGLLSVVMRNHSTSRLKLLDHAIFSLAAQAYRPLEIVLVTQSCEPGAVDQLGALLRRHQPIGGYTWKVVSEPSSRDIRARLVNVGFEHARGQYVAILDDDDVVFPQHYQRLIQRIRESDRAWAFAPVQRAYFKSTPSGGLYCTLRNMMPRSDAFRLAELAYDNYVTCHSYVIDRTRLGTFRPRFEESLDKGEDYVMVLRLMALFEPLATGGVPSAEYRIRDNGSNTIIHETSDGVLAQRIKKEWGIAIARQQDLTRPLQVLLTLGQVVQEARSGIDQADAASSPPNALRYRLVEVANASLKSKLPWIHSSLKSILGTRLEEKDSRDG